MSEVKEEIDWSEVQHIGRIGLWDGSVIRFMHLPGKGLAVSITRDKGSKDMFLQERKDADELFAGLGPMPPKDKS